MMNIRNNIFYSGFLSLFLLPALPAVAQLHESVEVEGKYNKEVLYPEKLHRLPERRRLLPEQNELPYQLNGVTATFTPAQAPMSSTAFGAQHPDIPPRGYLNFEMGSWLNTYVEAGYTVLNSQNESLNIWLNHNSTSLWKPYHNNGYETSQRKSYQEALAARYNRQFYRIGLLEVGLRYKLGYFNYYGVEELPHLGLLGVEDYSDIIPTQTLNDLSFNASLTSERKNHCVNLWNAGIGTRFFALRTGSRETNLHIYGGYARKLSDISTLGFDGNVNGLFYSSAADAISPDSYGNIALTPFYRFAKGNTALKLGANLFMTFNADGVKDNESYSVFHAAPDVTFDYNSGRFAGWIHAKGGQDLLTLSSIVGENLYCFPSLQSSTPVYSPIDAAAGLRIAPFGGFTAEAEFRYKVSKNVAGLGWGTCHLADKAYNSPGLFLPVLNVPEETMATYGLGRARYNLSGWSARMKITYNISDIVEVAGEATYTPQNSSHGIYNGLDRPRWLLSTGFRINPVKTVTVGVDYEYRGVRNVWSALEIVEVADTREGGIAIPGQGGIVDILEENPSGKAAGFRLPDVTRLNADVEWKLPRLGSLNNLTVGFHARNILNRRDMLLPMLPSEGVTFSGSVQILF